MKNAYCLYRVSTKKQVDKAKDDIPMQKIACHEFAEEKENTLDIAPSIELEEEQLIDR